MEFKKSRLQTVRNALKVGVMYAQSEHFTAEFALLLVEVEAAIIEEKAQDIRLEKLKSLEGCVFKYCAYNPKCEGKCANT